MAERRIAQLSTSIFAIFLLLSTLFQYVHTAAVQLSTAPAPAPSASLSTDNSDSSYCTNSYTWTGGSTRQQDCVNAVQQFYNVEVDQYKDTDFEFLTQKLMPQKEHLAVRTPRRYTWGKLSRNPGEMKWRSRLTVRLWFRFLHPCDRHAWTFQARYPSRRPDRRPCIPWRG